VDRFLGGEIRAANIQDWGVFLQPSEQSGTLVSMTYETTSESVFFYGLFMDGDVLWQKGLSPRDFKLARVEGYGLRIGERATLEVSETEQVFGSIMKLRTEELKLLYGEESVADYVSVRLTATDMAGKRIESISYILPMDQLSGRNPNYARALLLAADKIGIPNTHLRTIESWI
jgi:hypothetical protein